MMKKLPILVVVAILVSIGLVYAAECPFPDKCNSSSTIGEVITKYYEGECTKNQVDACQSILYGKCPYPETFDCNTKEELDIIVLIWETNPTSLCSMDVLNQCIGKYNEANQCSYPSKVDCNTFEETKQVLIEYNDGRCTWNELVACNNAWTSCPYPSKIDCDTYSETETIATEYGLGNCKYEDMIACKNHYYQVSCSYPSKYDCTTEQGFNVVQQEWQQGKCSDDIWPLCVSNYNSNRPKCSYPSIYDCDIKEEVDIIAQEWQQGKCTRDELGQCSQYWMDNQPKCSYPSKYDCNTKTEFDVIENEWKKGICSMNEFTACISNYQANNPKCSYPSKYDCNTKEEADIITNEWEQGKCTWEQANQCVKYWTDNQPKCGDNKCNGAETCSTCPSDCRCGSYETCINGVCVSACGNRRIDPGETCSSCPADAGCSSGLTCKNGICVGCVKDSQCKSTITYSGEFICSPGHKKVFEKGVKIEGFCKNGECIQKENDITQEVKDCGTKFCQDGHCGCSEGYEVCQKTEKCEKQFGLEENSKCGCDFQCESSYCSNGKCLNALDIAFSSTKSELKPGEEATITLSVSNNLNKEIQFSGTANIGTGSEMVEIISGDDCSGNQCKISGTLDEMGRTETTIVVKSNSNKPIPLSASVGCTVDNKELEIRKEDVINKEGLKEITGNVVAEGAPISKNLIKVLITFGVVFFGLGILYFTCNIGKHHGSRKKKK